MSIRRRLRYTSTSIICDDGCGGGGGAITLSDPSAGPSCGGSSSFGGSSGFGIPSGGSFFGNPGSSSFGGGSGFGTSGGSFFGNPVGGGSSFGESSGFSTPSGGSFSGNPGGSSSFGGDGSFGDSSSFFGGSGGNFYGNAVGDPINSATGDMFIVQHDYVGTGPFPLRFTRTYNSLEPVPGIATTELGSDWRGFYDRSIALLSGQSSPTARVVRPDGKSFLFTLTNGVWTPSPDVTARLASISDTSGNLIGWTYTGPRGTVETYDASGRLLSIVNRNGLTKTLTYDTAGDLATVSGPFGRTLTFTYNGSHQLARMTDPAGGVYRYGYDGSGNLTSVTDPGGATRTYLYEDPAFPHALTGVIDANGVRFATWTYDSQGRAVGSTLAGGARAVSLTFNDDGTTSVTNARGAIEIHSFDTIFGDPKNAGVTVTCPGCTPMANDVTYDADGFVASRTDFNGNTTDYTYNARGLLVSRTEAVGTPQARTVTVTWSPVFRRPTQIRFSDRMIDFTYDAHGNRLTKMVTDGTDTRTWTYRYNHLGLLTEVDGPRLGVADVTRFSYDAQGELASVTNALNHVWRITAYDPNGRPLSIIGPNGVVTTFAYDPRGRLMRRTRDGRTTTYTRNAVGKLTRITRPNGMRRTFSYDTAHRLIAITNSAGDRLLFTLDAAGDRVEREVLDSSGNVVRVRANTFNPLGRLTKRTNGDEEMTRFTYDPDGNRLSLTNPLGNTWSATYDALNRRVSITDPDDGVTRFRYDRHNHLTRVIAPNGAPTQYTYDGFGDRLSETSPDRGRITFSYNHMGEPVTRTDARGITATFRYDALNRLTAIDYPVGSSRDADDAARDDVRLIYDTGRHCTFGVGRLCAAQRGSETTRYGYNAFGRHRPADREDPSPVLYHALRLRCRQSSDDDDLSGRTYRRLYP